MQSIEIGLIILGGIVALVVLVRVNIGFRKWWRDASAKERADLDRDLQQW